MQFGEVQSCLSDLSGRHWTGLSVKCHVGFFTVLHTAQLLNTVKVTVTVKMAQIFHRQVICSTFILMWSRCCRKYCSKPAPAEGSSTHEPLISIYLDSLFTWGKHLSWSRHNARLFTLMVFSSSLVRVQKFSLCTQKRSVAWKSPLPKKKKNKKTWHLWQMCKKKQKTKQEVKDGFFGDDKLISVPFKVSMLCRCSADIKALIHQRVHQRRCFWVFWLIKICWSTV